MVRECTKRAIAKYEKENVPRISLKFYPKDHDLIEWLRGKKPGLNAYVMELLRREMDAESEAQRVTTQREDAEGEEPEEACETA